MRISEIKRELARKATIFHTGGKRPTTELGESWIGSVRWKAKNEEMPLDDNKREMNPLATIFIENRDYSPKVIDGINLITIFISESFYEGNIDFNNLAKYFTIRTYSTTKNLIKCQWNNKYIKPFPLTEEYVNNDYPLWDNGGIPDDLFEMLYKLEDSGEVDYFDDIVEEMYSQHKIGGYPCFCQSGYWFSDSYEYVLQISSDEKAKLNIIHSGSFYFYYNLNENDWKVHCDFY